MSIWHCIDCENYDINDKNRHDEGYCTYYHKYFPKGDNACSSHFKHRSDYSPGGCFITTTICDIFGFEDDCYALELLREYREKVLFPNVKYHGLLAEYEYVGPLISKRIYEDPNKEEVAAYYYENYLFEVLKNLSTVKDYNEAINVYVAMINDLKRMYLINRPVTDEEIDELTSKINRHEYKVKKRTK